MLFIPDIVWRTGHNIKEKEICSDIQLLTIIEESEKEEEEVVVILGIYSTMTLAG